MSETTQPRAERSPDAWIGGVCAGLARHLGGSALPLRVAFVVAASFRLVGVPFYLVLWLALPRHEARHAPGVEAATRAGMRSPEQPVRWVDAGVALALAVLYAGLTWLVEGAGWGLGTYLWPALVASAGVGLVWRSADGPAERGAGPGADGWWHRLLPLRWTTVMAVVAGMALMGVALWLLVWADAAVMPGVALVAPLAGLDLTGQLLLTAGLSVAAIVVAILPWVVRTRRALAQARADKLVADARADMAAHLHDSVLQTLALIQRRADDPRAVAALARRQERELRTYLYGETAGEASLSEALTNAAMDVEADHGVSVEVVAVGDAPMDAQVEAIVRAAGEAMVNAALHSGAERVDVYAEVDDDQVAVYVRDRGSGFDLDAIDADRAGVRRSIVGRMERAGGRAIIRTAVGEGTEVRLELPR